MIMMVDFRGGWGNQHKMVVNEDDVLDHGNEYQDDECLKMIKTFIVQLF